MQACGSVHHWARREQMPCRLGLKRVHYRCRLYDGMRFLSTKTIDQFPCVLGESISAGLGIGCEIFAENDTAVNFARPLNPPNMTVAKASVELDQMCGLFGSVHRELFIARLLGPLLSTFQEHATNA